MAGINHRETFDYLFDQFQRSDMTRLSWQEGDFSVTLERGQPDATHIHHHGGSPVSVSAVPTSEPAPQARGHVITAPLVGTFYLSPAPDAEPYVKAGQAVKPGDVLCIVEAMKTMNEIECDVAGTVTRVLAQNGALVEYGAPLFEIE